MQGPLSGVKVFDLTIVGVGPFATGILGGMGADVIGIEQGPQWPPAYQGSPPEMHGLSTLYMTVHLNKRSLYLNLKDPDGLATAYQLLQGADIFAENMTLGTVQRLGLGYDEIAGRNPGIVYGNFPGWGRQGPIVERRSADAITQTFSGPVAMSGKAGGRPELLRWPALWDFNASLHIAVSLLLGLLYRERTGEGLSLISPQVGASANAQRSRFAEYLATGEVPSRWGSGTATTVPNRAYLCRDRRWLAVGVVSDEQWLRLCKALGSDDLARDETLLTNSGRVRQRERVDEALGAILTTGTADWWEIQLRKARVPVSRFLDHHEILNDPQICANKYFTWLQYPRDDANAVAIEYPEIGKYPELPVLPFGNLPFQYSKTPIRTVAGVLPGAHTGHILKHGWDGERAAASGYHGPAGPVESGVLTGVTIVDMTQGISGPFASLMLAESGARVIKVEPPEGDYTRGWEPKQGDVGAAFYHLNRNKTGIRLDLEQPEDRARLKELLKEADVFIEETGQARLVEWGLDHASLEAINPALVSCSVSPFGEDGPLSGQPGSELIFQAMSEFLTGLGNPDEEPVRMGPDIASSGTSLYICQAILGALYHQWRTGDGQRISVSELGALMHQRAIQWTSLVDPDAWNGYLFGYIKPADHPYLTKDQSVMLSPISNAKDLPMFMRDLGMGEYVDDPRFQHPPVYLVGWGTNGGIDTGDTPMAVKPILEQAFSKFTAEELGEIFQKYGGDAVVCNDYQQFVDHPQIQAINLFGELGDPVLGRIRFQRVPWSLDGVPEPAPTCFREVDPATRR